MGRVMGRVIVREFLKALPRRTLLWSVASLFAVLVWILVVQAGTLYMPKLDAESRALNLTTAEQLREFIELAPSLHPVKGMALLLNPRLAPSHGLALFTVLGGFIGVFLASKLFGDEYGLGTIRRLWTEGPPRAVLLAGKVGGLCLTIVAAMAFTCLVAVLLTPVVRWFYPIPWLSGAEFPPLGQLARRVAVQLLVSMAIVLFPALLVGTIAAAARSTLAGAITGLLYVLVRPESFLPASLQALLPQWHVRALQVLAFPEFVLGPHRPATVQMGNFISTVMVQRELPAMIILGPLPVGLEPSLAASLTVLGAYMLVFIATLHVVWRRQEAP